ncbi:MAG: hypothetical protein K9M99_08610 [Candidatus Cloacimonetes bacterium]|nr:hypothetical protein [Candidatus Cloacimonadota bacterium]
MHCKSNEFIRGGYYHIYNCAKNEGSLFHDDDDFMFFKETTRKNSGLRMNSIICWSLLPCFYHYLFRQNWIVPAYKVFKSASRNYSNHYKSKYDLKGKLFNRIQHEKVNGYDHLLQICTDIHLMPVKHGFVDKPEDWKFSDYCQWIDNSENQFRDEILNLSGEEYREKVIEKIDRVRK